MVRSFTPLHRSRRSSSEVRQRRHQLGLGAALQAHVPGLAGVEHLLHDFVELVDLDGIHAAIDVAVAGLGDGGGEGLVQPPHPRAQHVLEADQHREAGVAAADLGHDLHDVDGELVLRERAHGGMALLVDEEEVLAPGIESIELGGALGGPRLGLRRRDSSRGTAAARDLAMARGPP